MFLRSCSVSCPWHMVLNFTFPQVQLGFSKHYTIATALMPLLFSVSAKTEGERKREIKQSSLKITNETEKRKNKIKKET